MKYAVSLAVLAACSFEHGVEPMPARDDAQTARIDAPVATIDAAIDAPAVDARECPPPPPSCTAFSCPSSGSCYYLCGTATSGKLSWESAQSSCESQGLGCLVTIDNQAEQDCIAIETMPMFPGALVWFGFRQSSTGSEPAGDWGWECESSNYVSPAWGDFEPNNFGGNEDCGALTNGGGWIDADCSLSARFVCELP